VSGTNIIVAPIGSLRRGYDLKAIVHKPAEKVKRRFVLLGNQEVESGNALV
jgi:hypothetical protein